MFYTTALTPEMANGYIQGSKPVVLEGGEYVMFSYEGAGNGRTGIHPDRLRNMHAYAEPESP